MTLPPDDWKTRSGAAIDLPDCQETPPCSALISAPSEVFRDRARWPRHICPRTMKESTRRWANRQVGANPEYVADQVSEWRHYVEQQEDEAANLYPAWAKEHLVPFEMRTVPFATPEQARARRREFDALTVARKQMATIRDWWKECWPLPVGRLAFRREQRDYKGCKSEAILPVLASLPFDGEEEALLALRIEIARGALLELFALAVRDDEASGVHSFYFGQLAYRLSGKDAMASNSPALITSAQAWLARFSGLQVTQGVGRPRKGSIRDFDEIMDAARLVGLNALSDKTIAAALVPPITVSALATKKHRADNLTIDQIKQRLGEEQVP